MVCGCGVVVNYAVSAPGYLLEISGELLRRLTLGFESLFITDYYMSLSADRVISCGSPEAVVSSAAGFELSSAPPQEASAPSAVERSSIIAIFCFIFVILAFLNILPPDIAVLVNISLFPSGA